MSRLSEWLEGSTVGVWFLCGGGNPGRSWECALPVRGRLIVFVTPQRQLSSVLTVLIIAFQVCHFTLYLSFSFCRKTTGKLMKIVGMVCVKDGPFSDLMIFKII